MKKIKEEKIINDLVYFKDLKIVQNKNYFNFSLDSVLLPSFVIINPNTKKILDLCTGNAPIPLILSTKTNAEIIGVEIQKEIYDLAVESVKINKKDNIKIINKDVKDIINDYETDTFDLITCNPPYFKYIESSKINLNEQKTIARHEVNINIEDILKLSKKLLKNGGSLCIIHRTDRLIEIIELFKKYNIEPKRIQLIYPKVDSESNLFLIDGRKNGKTGLKLLRPLFVHNEDGSYKDEILKIFGK
ncbi:MAG: tRNA1(Val) (adenine(37)-N6)-methyltransferase [Bacilli bacterium]|nr:tRNA1(Val) (adenine(37)-N6)-methyltransferase [Bacilli bacterium]